MDSRARLTRKADNKEAECDRELSDSDIDYAMGHWGKCEIDDQDTVAGTVATAQEIVWPSVPASVVALAERTSARKLPHLCELALQLGQHVELSQVASRLCPG